MAKLLYEYNLETYSAEALKKGFIVISDFYKNYTTSIMHKCIICGYETLKPPYCLLGRETGCRKCKKEESRITTEEYIIETKNKKFEPLEEYKGSKIKILHSCRNCKTETNLKPNTVLRDAASCIKCDAANFAINKTKTDAEYKDELLKIHKGNIISLEDYTRCRNKILHRHLVCGYEWLAIPTNMILRENPHGCPACTKKAGVFGCPTISNGIKFASKFEASIADVLYNVFEHSDIELNKRYKENSKHNCDFYIKSLDLWIEVSCFKDMKYHAEYHEKI